MPTQPPQRVAIIGAGIAGAACARALADAGHAVQVFDKARGPGGRMATRRLDWVDTQGQARSTRLDHGAVGISARTDAFQGFVRHALQAGWLVEWNPVLAATSLRPEHAGPWYLPVPELTALCRQLLDGVATSWSLAVEQLHRGALGWQLQAQGERHDASFDAVVLALPPAQAAPLLAPHRPDWARHASVAAMQPCWTLMGIARATEAPAENGADAEVPWDLTLPAAGPLVCVVRNDRRPGRERVPGQAHWVAHARAGWSRRHLEQPAAWAQTQLQAALADHLGRPVHWLHSTAHRWRYAMPQVQYSVPAEVCWWDTTQGLGACGDFLGGWGVEGAWSSARSLCMALLAGDRGRRDWAQQA